MTELFAISLIVALFLLGVRHLNLLYEMPPDSPFRGFLWLIINGLSIIILLPFVWLYTAAYRRVWRIKKKLTGRN